MIKGLSATSPDDKLKDKLMLFGQFIGNWDIVEARYPQPDGSEIKKRGSIHFGWILDGLAIQDVWMTYEEKARRFVPAGTTIRYYNLKIDVWQSIWISPSQNITQTFIGRKIKDEIVLESCTKEGYPEKWIFSDITPQSFRWHSVESHDNGTTWNLTEEMEVRRSRETPT
ncbi:MAG: hypothetical protein ACFFEK_07390 [Candidatus Thorarchaeota archaeon]